MNKRFFGLDLHKKYATICGISQRGHMVLREEHLPLEQLPTWAARTLKPSDAVALVTNGLAAPCLMPVIS